jgi:undecaprenyl-diphosphatase
VPRLTGRPRPRSGHLLLASPGRDLLVTGVTLVLTGLVLAAVALPRTHATVQRADDALLDLMAAHRPWPVTTLALLLDVLGSVWITLPVRGLLAAWLAWHRRWWHLAAAAVAVLTSELLIGTLKDEYERIRPAGSLVSTSGASFPSGHAVAASVTVLVAVIVLLPPGRTRARWGAAAVGFSILMALSRAYLGAHWLSDAVAGVLVGTSCALVATTVVGLLQGRSIARAGLGGNPVAPDRENRAALAHRVRQGVSVDSPELRPSEERA